MPPSWIVTTCLTGRALVQWRVGGGALETVSYMSRLVKVQEIYNSFL